MLNGLAKRTIFFSVAFIIMIFAIGVPHLVAFGESTYFQGALQNGSYIGLALMIITSLIAMYSLFRVLFYMYFGDKDGEEVHLKIHNIVKGILSDFSSCGYRNRDCSAYAVKNNNDATGLNTNDQLYQKLVNPHLKGGINESNCFKYYHCILMGFISR